MKAPISFDRNWTDSFLERLEEDGPWSDWNMYRLALTAEEHLANPDFEGLRSLKFLPELHPLPHQLEVARQVIEQMNGKAILADEVGLGKTIEAGLILKEYMIRGLVKKVLILVPASLVSQWVRELWEKFHIHAIAFKKSYRWEEVDVMVASIDTAKKSPHREILMELHYDMLIIDEAHKLKNQKSQNYLFVQGLKKKFCLLLTATPIQNRVEEIFHLISLLKPGHLGTYREFLDRYKKKKGRQMDGHLQELVHRVMIRTRRKETGIEWKKRFVETIFIEFTPEERQLYEMVSALPASTGEAGGAFRGLTLKREACSSKEAVFLTLKNLLKKFPPDPGLLHPTIEEIFGLMNRMTVNSKAEKALALIREIDDKVILFTEFRATQLYLQWFFKQNGITSVPFRGGFRRGKKDWMRELFQNRAQVFIATEAGGEGINLQFCSHVINYDLPWNPMRLEQRIGRVHRLGQTRDVHIYNFIVKNTVEEHVMKLLYEKIGIFERVIGELEEILTRIDIADVEEYFEDMFEHSSTEGEMRVKMENFAAIVEFAQSINRGEGRAQA